MNRTVTILLLVFGLSNNLLGQDSTSLLLITNQDARVVLDGEEIGHVSKNNPEKFKVTSGEHYLQVLCQCLEKLEHSEVLSLESNKQKVFKVMFESNAAKEKALKKHIAQFDFSIPGIMAGATSEEPIEYPTYYYAFESGDKVELNLNMSNEKGINSLEVVSYPDGRTIYSKDGFQDLHNLTFPIQTRGIYGFVFSTNHAFARNVSLTISRIPASEETFDFNSEVVSKEIYSTKVIHQPQSFFINGGSKATLGDGKSRTYLPIDLPENTVKWYYEFTAQRDERENNSTEKALNLASELAGLIANTNVLTVGLNQLTKPPGADYCDIYLLGHENLNPFISKQKFNYFTIGTRENIKSGIVEIDFQPNYPLYLGIRNPATFYGINVAVEVVAIVKKQQLVMLDED